MQNTECPSEQTVVPSDVKALLRAILAIMDMRAVGLGHVQRQLQLFKRQYFQLLRPELLTWPDATVLKSLEVQQWLFEQLFDVEAIDFPPHERYQLRVLKELMSKVVCAVNDPEEDVCNTVTLLLYPGAVEYDDATIQRA